ncbi:MAG: insulinase family protein [Phycisphaerae bacterium]
MSARRSCVVMLIVSCGLLGLPPVRGDTPAAKPVNSPLPRDDGNVYGELPNHFKTIIRPHKNPPNRLWIYLHVDSGALNESDTQNGLAHFLEHMAFNGSKHFKPGELVPLLDKMGMQFGADTNAHTNHEETVYKLFLPDNKPETIETGLTIMADFAYGLDLLATEIDKERGVILEESRSRKSAMERLQKESMRRMFPDTQIARHDVIGDESQIRKFPRDEFADYYDSWYRPENMTLIVVGDVDAKQMAEKIEPHFKAFAARKPARAPRGTGVQPVNQPRAFVLTDDEQVGAMVRMSAILPGRPPVTTYEQYRAELVEDVSTWIVSRRLRELVTKGKAAFRRAGVNVGALQHDAVIPTGTANGDPQDWNKMLDQLIAEVSRAIEHGFTASELDLARRELLSDAERAVELESTLDAGAIIARTSGAIGDQRPLLSARQRLALVTPVLAQLNPDSVHEAFVASFRTKNYTYALLLPAKKADLKLPSSEEVLAAASAAWARKTEPPHEAKAATDLLAKIPEPGAVDNTQADDKLKVTTVTFKNGVVMHHHFTDYKKQEVLVDVLLPGGDLEETADNRGVSDAASLMLRQPATARLDSTQIRDLMTGRKVRVGGGIGRDAVGLGISGSPRDIELGLQLAYAMLTEGRIEPAGLDNWKKMTKQRLERMHTMPQGVMQEAMTETVLGNDVRLKELTPEQIDRVTPGTAEAWFRRIAATAPIEISVVGDLPLDAATQLVARYFGSLPKRGATWSALDSLRTIKRGAGPYSKTVHFKSRTPKAMVMAGFISCNERDVLDRRLLTIASQIISDRMIQRIRENEQLVYSIRCGNRPARELPGTGLMMAAAPTDPQNGDKLADTILQMLHEFADQGPTDQEVTTARKQLITQLTTRMQDPRYWQSVLADMTYRGRALAEIRELPDVYNTYTATQIRDAVRKYLKDDQVVRIIAIPDGPPAGSAADPQPAPMRRAPGEQRPGRPPRGSRP